MLKKKITEKELLNRVSDSDIFRHYFGEFDFNKCYPSVFRKDVHPSTGFFKNKNNRIVYNDLSTGEKLGAINFVGQLYNLSYYDAIDKIARDFGLIEGTDNTPLAKIKKYRPKEKVHKRYDVLVGKFNERELDYWKDYSISKQELLDHKIYPLRELRINDFLIENPKNYLRFVYSLKGMDNQEYVKIYSPYDPIYKWIGSVPKNVLFGLTDLKFQSDTLVITKGNKDLLIWKKYFTDVIAPQSESPNSIPEDICELLNNSYSNIYVNFDCDEPGKKGSLRLTEKYGWKHINVPDVYYQKEGIKDFADLVKIKGLKTFENYLRWKKLLK